MSVNRETRRPAAVVLAAGKGTRMRSQHAKVVHNVAGEPMVSHVVRLLHTLGIAPADIVIVVGHGAAEVQAALADPVALVAGTPVAAQYAGEPYLFAEQGEQKGTAHAVLMAKPLLAERQDVDSVLILYGDTPLLQPETMQAFLAAHYGSVSDPAQLPFLTVLTAHMSDPTGYGRILRDPKGQISGVVEEKDGTPEQRLIHEINTGIFLVRPSFLWSALEMVRPSPVSGEYYLPELVRMSIASRKAELHLAPQHSRHHQMVRTMIAYPTPSSEPAAESIAHEAGDVLYRMPDEAALSEFHGINDRAQLARANHVLHMRIVAAHMAAGVSITDPASTYIGAQVEIGMDTVIEPNTHLRGRTRIGSDCVIGPNAILSNAIIGNNSSILASFIEDSTIEDGVDIGPVSHVRGDSYIESGVHLGNFAEMKKTRIGRDSKMGHFSYLGDATVGTNVNIGAGSITANYDGKNKFPTRIGNNVFIGSDSILRAPLTIGNDAGTGAGAVVTKNVPDGKFVVGVPARIIRRTAPRLAPSDDVAYPEPDKQT